MLLSKSLAWKAVAGGLLLLLLAGLLLFARNSSPPPALSFKSITGEQFHLADFSHQPVLVTFWASDCGSCVKEMPHLQALYQKFHGRGLALFAVAMPYDVPSHVVNLAREQALAYPVILDLKGEISQAFGQVALTPTTFLLAPGGQVVAQTLGALDIPKLEQQIEAYLAGET